jgi:hypothetical protein
MIIGVQGSSSFSDYQIFLRAMGTALSMIGEKDKEIIIYSSGPHNINAMTMEFVNITERSFKGRGLKVKMQKAPASWLRSNHRMLDYFIYLSRPKENLSPLAAYMEKKNVEVGIYRY